MAQPSGAIKLNRRDASELGLGVRSFADWWSKITYARQHASPYDVAGTIPADEATANPRRIPIEFLMEAAFAARPGALDAIYRHCQGLVEIAVGDDFTRVAYGELVAAQGTAFDRSTAMTDGATVLRFDLVCYDPVKYSQQWIPLALANGARVTVDCGTLPSTGITTLFGPFTNAILRSRRFGGQLVGEMNLTYTAGSADALRIDHRPGHQTIEKIESGVATTLLSALANGEWFLFWENGWTIEVSGAGGVHYYQKAYE